MKSTIQLLMAMVLLSFTNVLYGQTVHTIILNVETGIIENSNKDEVCNFGQDQSVSNEDFTITVKNGDTVRWVGFSSDAPDSDKVDITSINHEGGARVFGRNKLNDTDGVVVGIVTEGRDGDEEKYKVSFKVYNNGVKRQGTFNIDPKIKVGG